MSVLRAVPRLVLFAGLTGFWFVVWLATRVLVLLPGDPGHRAHRFCVWSWATLVTKLLGVRIEVDGTPPEPPFFLVSNHLSYLDVIVLFTVVDGFFLAKSEVASWPVLGFLARATGTEFVDRGRKADILRANERLSKRLVTGRGIIVFPEGTSSEGAEVLPFKPSLLQPAVALEIPLSTVSVAYRTANPDPPAHLSVCWWGDMTFFDHFFALLGLRSIDARLNFGHSQVSGSDRKELASQAHVAICEHFQPSVTCPTR